jgi:hypothetical protein
MKTLIIDITAFTMLGTGAQAATILLVLLSFTSNKVFANKEGSDAVTHTVSSLKSFKTEQGKAGKGDTIVWRNGSYEDINFEVKKSDVAIMAEDPGKVIFTGKSFISLDGDNITFKVFLFTGGYITGKVLIYVTVKNNRLTDFAIIKYNPL